MPLTRAPRYPAASPTSSRGASKRASRYAASRARRRPDALYWLNVPPMRVAASASTSSSAPIACSRGLVGNQLEQTAVRISEIDARAETAHAHPLHGAAGDLDAVSEEMV